MMKIAVRNRCSDLPLPRRASEHASGFDLHAAVEQTVVLQPGERATVPTGISIAIPPGFEGQVRARSGLAARNGIALVNAPGTIDADFRGEIHVLAINLGSEPFPIARGDRIAQLVIAAVAVCDLDLADELSETTRGERGFGSSGV